jgi:O-antigen ligase
MISVLINDGSWADLLPITVFAGFSFIAYTFGTVVDDRDFGHIIARAATLSVVLFAAACVVYGWDLAGAIRRGQRLVADGMHPNLFGLIAMTIFVAAAVGRDSKNFVFCLIAMLAACLAASSRSALLTLLVIAVVSRLILVRSAWKAVAIVAAMAFLLTVLVAFDGDGLGNVANTVFHVNDKYRGAATGGSGRPIIWAYYIDNWLAHPLFGTGPGTVYDLGGRAYYSHNMVLQILTDGGLFGLLGFITFIIWVSIAATQIPASSVTRALAMFLLAYFIYGIFEGRAVNIGNPLSAMFFLACFLTLGHAERVRGKDRQSHAA